MSATIKDVRAVIDAARTDRELHGRTTVLFIDEVHRFSKTQQDALLPAVENGWVTLVGATTENPSFAVIPCLLSRSILVPLRPLEAADLEVVVDRALSDSRGLAGRVAIDDDARDLIVRMAGGDARRALTLLEVAAGDRQRITLPDVESAVQQGRSPLRPSRRPALRRDVSADQVHPRKRSGCGAALSGDHVGRG